MTARFTTLTAALDTVLDPELDEPITTLGFVLSGTVTQDGVARVRLKLPTFFCAPNFAYLMVADAHEAALQVRDVVAADVKLEEHLFADQINEGVAAQAGFTGAFGDEASAELDELRASFLRKAVLAGSDRVCRPLAADGATPADLAAMTLGSVPESPDLARLRHRRSRLGLPAADGDPLLIDPATGEPVGVEKLGLHLRFARTTAVGMEANSGMCRDQLAYRVPGRPRGDQDQAEPLRAEPSRA